MKKGWNEVPLSEVLELRDGAPTVEELALGAVRIVSKIKFSSGTLEFRNSGETKTGMIRISPGDLVVSGINAAKGAIAIYSYDSTEDAAATIHYSAYRVRESKANNRYLWWLLRSSEFRRLLSIYLPGGIKTELKPKRFLPIPIPLPPLSEQQKIVAHLDAIESRLSRAQKLREESALESLALVRSLMDTRHCNGVKQVPMHELVTWRSPDVIVSQNESYTFAGVYSFGRGVFRKNALEGTDFAYDRLTKLRMGEFTFPKLMAWEGALGVVPPDCDGCHVSPEFPVFTVDESKVLPEILDIHFKTPAVWKDLAAISTGTNLRRRRLNPNAFLNYQFPLPPMEMQQHVKSIADSASIERKIQQNAVALEKALIPSLLDGIFNS